MSIKFAGIHYVTAIASNPQENVDSYSGVLGLRLVKKTLNFDDPESYHLYYGDAVGNPGTIITFFSWPLVSLGRIGTGQVTATPFAVPEAALGYWTERLVEHGIRFEQPEKRFGETVLAFRDPDRIAVELVAQPARDGTVDPWKESPVPPEHAIRGIRRDALGTVGRSHHGLPRTPLRLREERRGEWAEAVSHDGLRWKLRGHFRAA